MSTESELWRMNWKFVQSINELTEEIIGLKQQENNLKDERQDLLEQLEELKMKYYVALADLNQEKKKSVVNKRGWFFQRRCR
jgi:hypothetical protein